MTNRIWLFGVLALFCGLAGLGRNSATLHKNAAASRPSNADSFAKAVPEDQPGEAERFFTQKRALDGVGPAPIERYIPAMRHARRMSQHSTSLDATFPSEAQMQSEGTLSTESLGAWTQLGPGNVGGRTRAILINPTTPSTMYAAGVAGGVWKTTNSGTSWTPVADLLSNIAVVSMVMDPTTPNTIYAGTGEGNFNVDAVRGLGIFKTTDAGTTWNLLANTSSSNFWFVNTLVISPNNNQRVYAGTNTGIWRSTDGGGTWSQIFNPGTQGGCFDLKIRTDQSTDYLIASFGTFTQAAVYRNTDAAGAGTWNSVLTESAMGLTSLAIAPSNQAVMYALASDKGTGGNYNVGLDAVFQSTDGGATWAARVRNTSSTKLNTLLLTNPIFALFSECGFGSSDSFNNQGWYDNPIAVDPLDPNKVWVGGIDLFRSDDGGANWGLASYWWAGGSAHADQHFIVFHPQYNGTTNQIMFVGNDGGVFETTNARAAVATGPSAACNSGNTSVAWTNKNSNYGVTQFYYGAVYPNGTTYFGGTQDNGSPRGTDGGGINAWSPVLGGDGGSVAVDPTNTNNLYGENTGLSIQKSTDGGASFSNAVSGITDSNFLFIAPFIMDPGNSQRLWTGGQFLWRTTNGASLWTQASSLIPGSSSASVSAIAVAPTNGNNALAGTSEGFILRNSSALTSTSSTTWASVRPRTGYVAGLGFDPSNANTAYATYSTFDSLSTDRHVYKTTDAGATWSAIDGSGANALPDIPAHTVVVDPHKPATLYVGTDLGVFVTLDGGANWARENTGFANVITDSLVINTISGNSTLFAFTHGRGAWRVALPSTTANYSGFQDGAGCGTISGWAWDANNPNSTVSVDIYDGTTLIATTPAGMYREDLLNVLASPNHGFSFPTPAGLKNGAAHSITVKIAGTSIALGGGPKTLTCSEASVSLQGFHDGVGCNNISGWARDVNDPGNIVNVDVYNGSTLIGTIAATQYRQDLADAFGNPYHGFNFPMPASLKDGQPHTITVKFGGTSTTLSNTPKTFTCSEVSQNLQGNQDPANCTSITGYAWDTNDNGSTINVAIYADGNFLVTIPAQQVSTGIGSGFHGYIYAVPASLKNGVAHSIIVRFSGTSTAVGNSPRTLTCP